MGIQVPAREPPPKIGKSARTVIKPDGAQRFVGEPPPKFRKNGRTVIKPEGSQRPAVEPSSFGKKRKYVGPTIKDEPVAAAPPPTAPAVVPAPPEPVPVAALHQPPVTYTDPTGAGEVVAVADLTEVADSIASDTV